MSTAKITRREALGMAAAGAVATIGSRVASGQAPPPTGGMELAVPPPATELVNVLQFEEQAMASLDSGAFFLIAGGDREPFDRYTLHPRFGEPTLDMDLGVTLLGQTLYTPIVAGPVSDLRRFHPEGESAALRGAEASYTLTMLSSRSSIPVDQLAREATGPFWFSVYAGDPDAASRARAAVALGAAAVFVTAGGPDQGVQGTAAVPPIDWRAVDAIRQGLDVPVGLKGVMTAEGAGEALRQGLQAIVVSDHGGRAGRTLVPLDALSDVARAVQGRVPVLLDGGIRRGTDVVKALILGADAVMLGRPIAWGLAAYGAEGVQTVLQRIQMETARNFGLMGASNAGELTPEQIRRHERVTS